MKWSNKELDADMNLVNDVVTAIRRIRSINNFNKDQSEGKINNIFIDLFIHSKCLNCIFAFIISHIDFETP